jgi:peptidoglycan hydrolase-like protein with peptidoglycan-binding domain
MKPVADSSGGPPTLLFLAGSLAGVMRKILAYVATAGVALALVTGCDQGGTGTAAPSPAAPAASPPEPAPSAPEPAPSAADPTSSAADPAPSASPDPSTTRPGPPSKLKRGAKGVKVTALQQRLAALGYWLGKADGSFGSLTQQAVYALQKAAGLGRDGVVGPKTQKALDRGVRPKATSRSGHVIEINLKRQLLMVVDDGTVSQVFNTATGSNQRYEHEGNTFRATTPTGRFTASRQIDGWRHGPLGPLWRPKYFNGGVAVHGAYSIPPYPASHGCARVSIPAMNWIWANGKLPLKTRVWVY